MNASDGLFRDFQITLTLIRLAFCEMDEIQQNVKLGSQPAEKPLLATGDHFRWRSTTIYVKCSSHFDFPLCCGPPLNCAGPIEYRRHPGMAVDLSGAGPL